GRFGRSASCMLYAPERDPQGLMTPCGAWAVAIVVAKANTDEVKRMGYFSGKKFAVELGTVDANDAKQASEQLVAAGKPGIDVQAFKTYADVLQTLAAGQVDGAFVGTEQAYYYQDKGQSFFRIAL